MQESPWKQNLQNLQIKIIKTILESALKISLLQTSGLVCVDAFALDHKSDIAELATFQKPALWALASPRSPTRFLSIQSLSLLTVRFVMICYQHGIGVALSTVSPESLDPYINVYYIYIYNTYYIYNFILYYNLFFCSVAQFCTGIRMWPAALSSWTSLRKRNCRTISGRACPCSRWGCVPQHRLGRSPVGIGHSHCGTHSTWAVEPISVRLCWLHLFDRCHCSMKKQATYQLTLGVLLKYAKDTFDLTVLTAKTCKNRRLAQSFRSRKSTSLEAANIQHVKVIQPFVPIKAAKNVDSFWAWSKNDSRIL